MKNLCGAQMEERMNRTQRFSSRAENYAKYRPCYPIDVLDTLKIECGLTKGSGIADIGSGTGILADLFLKNGNLVFGVEPNREMRKTAERLHQKDANFTSVNGTAEATRLDEQCVDFVTAGQAFHWFDRATARQEFLRILKPEGWVVLLWNERLTHTPFLQAYEHLLQARSVDYAIVDHRNIDSRTLVTFFGDKEYKEQNYPNRQVFDFEGLKGRLLSSSYTPEPGNPLYLPMLAELETLFHAHQVEGRVVLEYRTIMYYGQFLRSDNF
jgi:ubiquinone/menaquinone biosynthesis C-methylase UbiE